jgi:leucine-rich repeat protein SHOC2
MHLSIINTLTILLQAIILTYVSSLVQMGNNSIQILPSKLCDCTRLVRLDIAHNQLLALQGRVYQWTQLKYLDVSHNHLVLLPSAVGWLALNTLNIDGNPDLKIPTSVLESRTQGGVQALLTYQQIVCEQHRLIQNHLDKFSSKPGDGKPVGFLRAGAFHQPGA